MHRARSFAAGRWLVAVALASAAAAAFPGRAAAAASAWSDHQVVASRLVATPPAADGTPRLGLHFRLAPEWHVYWKHPGDAGAAPEVAIASGSRGAELGGAAVESELLFPAPQRFRLPGGLEALGYQGEVVYPLRLAAAPAPGTQLLASVDYVACAVECIPYHDELTLSLPAAADRSPVAEEELLRRWEARLPRTLGEAGVVARLRYRTGETPGIELEVGRPTGNALAGADDAPELFLEPAPGATFASPERVGGGAAVLFRAAVRPEVAGQLPRRLRVAWTVTGLRLDQAQGAAGAVAGVTDVPAEGEPTTGTVGSVDSSRTRPRAAALVAALLALLALAAALTLWLVPGSVPEALRRLPPPLLRLLGFVAAASLVWAAYRLAALLPSARVAAIELSWLAVALGARCASTSAGGGRRAWLVVAVAAAALGLWAAWPPAMLSP